MDITVGLIGVGSIASHHIEGIRANPGLTVAGVCDLDKERLTYWCSVLGCRGFTDYRDLLSYEFDVVVIALPHGMHCEVAILALEAGCHVVVEKPMAVSVDECNVMLRAAANNDRHVIVSELASFAPGAELTGQKFASGQLGLFLTASISNFRFYFSEKRPSWFLDPAMSGGGMFSNIGLHRLAVARSCLPGCTPTSVCASVCYLPEYEIEACTSAIVKYAEGGSVLYNEIGYFPSPHWLSGRTYFVFEAGIVTWDSKCWRMIMRDGMEVSEALPENPIPYAPVYRNLLKALQGEPYAPTAYEYAVDTAVVQAAYASTRLDREIKLSEPDWQIIGDAKTT